MSEVDRAEAELAGAQAVKSAVEGQTGFMVGFTAAREPEYSCETMLIPLEQVANTEKTFPWSGSPGRRLGRVPRLLPAPDRRVRHPLRLAQVRCCRP